MKLKLALVVSAAFVVVVLSGACSKKQSERNAGSSAGEMDGASAGAEDDAPEARDDAPVIGKERTQAFEQLKEQWSLQIEGLANTVDTIRRAMAEQNNKDLDPALADLDPRIAALRKSIADAKPSGGMAVLSVDMPKQVGETAELVQKAMLRMQEVMKAKYGHN